MSGGFSLGPIFIHFYGIVLMLGAVAGGWLATLELKRRGKDPEIVWDLLVYLIIGGVIGARLWHVLTPPPSSLVLDPATGQMVNPYFHGGIKILDILAIWNGGLGIPGTVIGGLVALAIYVRNNRTISFLDWTDIAAPSLALGQAIGRWGNFFNQELYGAPTNLPWKLFIDEAHRLPGFQDVAYYHPLFAYESLLNLANMLLLLWIIRRYAGRLRKGDVFNVYLIAYPLIRFSLDFLRLDASQIAGININQTVMAVVGIAAIIVLIWRHRPGSTAPFADVPAAEDDPASDAEAAESRLEDAEPEAAAETPRKRRAAAKKAG
jgi:phosphatidylglycerol:prolipoprotein diacylglycerol transferase